MLIDTNLTFSQQTCDLAVGIIFGTGLTLYSIGRFIVIISLLVFIYKIIKLWLVNKKIK
jgi:uncharacterized membrane protein (Fun14 family)